MARSFGADTLERKQRAEQRAEAREAEGDYWDALTSGRRAGLSGKIKAPPRLERRPAREGGGYRSRTASDYDWFYSLHPDEQKRIRSNWFTTGAGAASPDEYEDAGLTMTEWLALTRGIDASRAVAKGRGSGNPTRYGGRAAAKLVEKGRAQDHGTPTTRVARSTGDHSYQDAYGSSRVQYFTDAEGRVHPIRSSYQRPRAPSERRRRQSYDYEEPF
jgi:hypothetical protein